MAQLVDNLFELSRTNAGALRLAPAPVPLHDVVSDAIAGVAPRAVSRRITVVAPETGWPVVRAGEAELARVVRNLLINSVRYTPDDGTVHIAAGHDRDDVWLAVSDTCGGIPDDDLGDVFDVAFRGERARTPFRRRRRARARVSSDTPGAPLSTRETVALDTPASEATSAMFSRPSSAPTGRESKGAQPVTY